MICQKMAAPTRAAPECRLPAREYKQRHSSHTTEAFTMCVRARFFLGVPVFWSTDGRNPYWFTGAKGGCARTSSKRANRFESVSFHISGEYFLVLLLSQHSYAHKHRMREMHRVVGETAWSWGRGVRKREQEQERERERETANAIKVI